MTTWKPANFEYGRSFLGSRMMLSAHIFMESRPVCSIFIEAYCREALLYKSFDEVYAQGLFYVALPLVNVRLLYCDNVRRVDAGHYYHRAYGVAKLLHYLGSPDNLGVRV